MFYVQAPSVLKFVLLNKVNYILIIRYLICNKLYIIQPNINMFNLYLNRITCNLISYWLFFSTDSITCTDAYKKRIQSTESLFQTRKNYVYGWGFGNKSHISGWDIIIMYIDNAVIIMCLVIIFLPIVLSELDNSTLLGIRDFVLMCLLVPTSLYILYMNWFLNLLLIVSLSLFCVHLNNYVKKKFQSNKIEIILDNIMFYTYIMSILKAIGYILYLIFI